jgi:hypothetical protein
VFVSVLESSECSMRLLVLRGDGVDDSRVSSWRD